MYLVILLVSLYACARAGDQNDCTTTADYNVQFIIDESGSVGAGGYALSVDFVQNLISNDISPNAPISIFEFSTDVDLIYRFDQTQLPRSIMNNALGSSSFDGSLTATATAIQDGIDEFNRAIAAGDLVDGDRLMFIMTDGEPNRGGDPCALKPQLDALDIQVILIGVGSFDRTDVECLAVNARDSIIEIAAFTQDAFDAVEAQISTTVCPPDDGCTTSAEYNVQIIVDESGSVNFNGIDGFGLSIDFVEELVANQLSPNAPLSIFTFGTGNNPDIETVYQFEDDQTSRVPVLNALAAVNFDSGGTPTKEAISQGIAEFQAGIAGGHLNDGDRLLFLLTDGVPTTGSPCFLKAQLDALEIRVIVLGVGSQWNRDNVECLAEDEDIHLIGGFSEENFDDLIDEISETICPPDGCVTTTEYDVQFLIDESGSVPESGYELSIDFIQDLIINDISPDAKVSVFEFGTNVQLIYQFNDIQQPRANMIQVIEDADYNSGGTRTGDAVQAGINEWERAEAAGELSGGEKLLFILTDGRPNGGVDPCSLKDDLDALGVTVIIIGVGTFDRTRVDCLAVNDGDSVIEVAAFTEEAFDAVEAAISEETCPDDEIIVPEDPLPCREAQEYCKNTYGTNLATIVTDVDRTNAQDALNTANEPFGFIGLYSDDIETKWQFRSGAECPSDSAYRCVDFWRTAPGGFNNRPRCIGDGEGGFGCAVIYADDGTVDNDIPDTVPFPFLCDGA